MKHTKDALQLVSQGDGDGALAILDNLLSLAPRNHEGLRLKAEILDSRGRFDDSLRALHQLSQIRSLDAASIKTLENRALEEKEALIFSELTAEGRWYFSFPSAQVWVSLMGFVGCAGFLILAPQLLNEGFDRFYEMTFAFCFLVIMPWLALISLHIFGIKKILVGLNGLRVCKRFSEKNYAWNQISCAVIEYDKNPKTSHLKLHFYGVSKEATPFLSLDISDKKSQVKARRHFVRNVLSYIDIVTYIPRNMRADVQKSDAFELDKNFARSPADKKNPENTDEVA